MGWGLHVSGSVVQRHVVTWRFWVLRAEGGVVIQARGGG